MPLYSQLNVKKTYIFIVKTIDRSQDNDHTKIRSVHLVNEMTKNFVKLIKISLIIFFKFNLNHLFIGIGDYKKYFMLCANFLLFQFH